MSKIWSFIKNYLKSTDLITLSLSLILSIFGLVLTFIANQADDVKSGSTIMFSVGSYVITRSFIIQIAALLIGLFFAFILSKIDYVFISKIWWLPAGIAIFLVVLTYFIGYSPGGETSNNKAWLDIGGFSMQPSELLKIAFIITFSTHINKVADNVNSLGNIILLLLHGFIPTFLIILQGDIGNSLMFVIMFIIMLFAAGLKFRYFAFGSLALLIASPIIWFNLSDYQKDRFLIAFYPENDPLGDGYQQYNSRLIIGSGQLWGRGIEESGNLNLPVRESDFIFSVSGETFGFIGCVFILILLAFLMFRFIRISSLSPDPLGSSICIGMFSLIAVQSIINIGMNICLAPVIGVTLPFLSSGGSSTLTLFIGIGLILSVYIHSKPPTYIAHKRTNIIYDLK